MSFSMDDGFYMFCRKYHSRFDSKHRNNTESYVNLQTQNSILTRKPNPATGERASVFASAARGSFTIEASLTMTFFLLSVCGILYLFLLFHLQVTLQEAAERVTQSVAQYGYAKECLMSGGQQGQEWAKEAGDLLRWGFQTEFFRQSIFKYVSAEYLDGSCIRGGSNGILFVESRMLEEDGMVDAVMRYDVEIPIGFPGMTRFHFVQRSRKRAWTGRQEETDSGAAGENEEMVYVTETGTVYHLYDDCTHIRLSVQDVEGGQVDQLRNGSGGKYKPCEKCCGGEDAETTVYITKEGNRFHSTLGCSGLKRQVRSITKKEAEESMSLCGRCGAR